MAHFFGKFSKLGCVFPMVFVEFQVFLTISVGNHLWHKTYLTHARSAASLPS